MLLESSFIPFQAEDPGLGGSTLPGSPGDTATMLGLEPGLPVLQPRARAQSRGSPSTSGLLAGGGRAVGGEEALPRSLEQL